MAELLNVKNLTTYFYRTDGIVKAVDGISYSLNQGETLGIVGESGSGKSVSVLSLLKLLGQNGRIKAGEAVFSGRDLLKMKKFLFLFYCKRILIQRLLQKNDNQARSEAFY